MKDKNSNGGFTLVEVLVSVTIFAIVMSILYSTFSASSANAKIVEGMADDLSSLTGALDTFSHEVRGAYSSSESSTEVFSGKKEAVIFITSTPYVRDGEPTVQMVSYIFEEDRLIRRTLRPGSQKEIKGEYLLLEGIKDPAFSFFDGKGWIDAWPSGKNLPAGVRVVFSHKERNVENVIPVWSRM
jgi:type II secretion system protein J